MSERSGSIVIISVLNQEKVSVEILFCSLFYHIAIIGLAEAPQYAAKSHLFLCTVIVQEIELNLASKEATALIDGILPELISLLECLPVVGEVARERKRDTNFDCMRIVLILRRGRVC